MTDKNLRYYTSIVPLQMLAVFILLGGVVVWQWEVVHQIYLKNQINAVGWAVNGGILLLFFSGLGALVWRFFEYRDQESNIDQFLHNLSKNIDPMRRVAQHSIVAERYRTLRELNRRRANINQNALAATLLAAESSRNSFLKFVHNVLILTGVFGTIISLSLSLLGASDILYGSVAASGQASGLGTMIFGMSTALSTTLTAILAYLLFGYFYIKLTDTQTYLLSRVEEVTATTLLPHLQSTRDAAGKESADSMRNADELLERLGKSQQQYEGAVQALREAAESLSQQLDAGQSGGVGKEELAEKLARIEQQQQQSAEQNQAQLSEVIDLLRKGFRLQKNRS